MHTTPVLQAIDAVTVPVPDLDTGVDFYRAVLGHEVRWRNDEIGQAGLALAHNDVEIVHSTRLRAELVGSHVRIKRIKAGLRF